jgi:hypothetical protein
MITKASILAVLQAVTAAYLTMSVKQLSPSEAHAHNSSGTWKYLDVRTVEEFTSGHAPGAFNVPFMLK